MPALDLPFGSQVLIELHVPDFQLAYDFYKLFGFELQWMEDRYMVLRRGEQALCFYGGHEDVSSQRHFRKFPSSTPRGYGVEILLFVDKVEDLYKQVAGAISISSPLDMRPWGRKDFRAVDPFGYYLRISEPYNIVIDDRKKIETCEVVAKKSFKI